MKTLSQRIIDFAHSGESTTATDKDRQLADAAPDMLAALKGLLGYEDEKPPQGTFGSEIYRRAEESVAKATV